MTQELIVRHLGIVDYLPTWEAMKNFTQQRTEKTTDEVWFLQHPPVFTQGQAGKAEHVLNPGEIPVVQTDRGGQVTYHGPGQIVMYALFDLRRLNIGIRQLVNSLEKTVIDVLSEYGIHANSRCDAPGVYVDQAKICSIGLRVRKGCSYHGIAFNIKMNLEPFTRINPCGFSNLTVTQISDFYSQVEINDIEPKILTHLMNYFGYNRAFFENIISESAIA